jgi:AAA domain-containing protein
MKLRGNPEKAVEELRSFRKHGPWNLAAIAPDGGRIEVVSFKGAMQITAMRKWIAGHDGEMNLYWTPNPTRKPMTRKPKKEDIGRADFAFVDLDPKPGETPAEAKRRHREALEDLAQPPTFTYDTGGGLCALWMLADPKKIAPGDAEGIAAYEAINIGLRNALGGKEAGADACHSIDHLMRVPHTVNMPNAIKRAKGRVPVVAGDVERFAGRVYSLGDLPKGGAPNVASGPLAPIGPPEGVDVEDLPVSDGIKDLIQGGAQKGERSDAVYRVVLALHKAHVSPEEIFGVLTDDRYGIGEKFRKRDEAARKEVERIIRKSKAEVGAEFAEDPETDHLSGPNEPKRKLITPTPYVWTDPTKIPPRQWVYKPYYIRKFAGSTVATGGAGKSSLLLVETVAMASGKNLLGIDPEPDLKVWYWNGEDPQDELQRRIQAILKHYKVTAADIEGRLFVDSGRDTAIRIAELHEGKTKIALPVVNRMIEVIRSLKIDVVTIDPFVSSHGVPENDNNAIDQVAKKWADIADKTNTHIHISHHTRKTNGMGVTAEDSRGASSLHNAMRTRRAIGTMTASEAEKAGIIGNARLSYFKADTAGSSMTKPADGMEWYRFESVRLGNGKEFGALDGDEVGVVVKWDYKLPGVEDLTEADADVAIAALDIGGPWRASEQADGWAGEAVAKALHLDHTDAADRKRIKRYLKEWLNSGRLEQYEATDNQRKKKAYIRPIDFG